MRTTIVRHLCQQCETSIVSKFKGDFTKGISGNCDHCENTFKLDFHPESSTEFALKSCPICKGDEFFEQKAFNRNLGMAIVVIGALGMLIMIALGHEAPTAYIFLGAAVVIDWLLYQFLPNVTVCYKCDSVFKGIQFPGKTGEFSLSTHDGYRFWHKGEKTSE